MKFKSSPMTRKATASGRITLGTLLIAGAVFTTSVALSPSPLYAQTDTARIAGTVQDTTGAAIPSATVTVTNTNTNAVFTAVSDGSGAFTVNALPIGPYKATVTMTGFGSQTQNLVLSARKFRLLISSSVLELRAW